MRDEMINAALKAAYEKAGEQMRATKNRDAQKAMAKEAAEVIDDIIELGRENIPRLGAEQTP